MRMFFLRLAGIFVLAKTDLLFCCCCYNTRRQTWLIFTPP